MFEVHDRKCESSGLIDRNLGGEKFIITGQVSPKSNLNIHVWPYSCLKLVRKDYKNVKSDQQRGSKHWHKQWQMTVQAPNSNFNISGFKKQNYWHPERQIWDSKRKIPLWQYWHIWNFLQINTAGRKCVSFPRLTCKGKANSDLLHSEDVNVTGRERRIRWAGALTAHSFTKSSSVHICAAVRESVCLCWGHRNADSSPLGSVKLT